MEKQGQECCRRSFVASLADSAKRVLENPRVVPAEIRSSRLDICHSCDEYLPESDKCRECSCIMAIKTTFENMRCPFGKWLEYPEPKTSTETDEN